MFFLFRITGAMGKGLAVLTFDDEYQVKRRTQMNKRPGNLQEGLARSGRGLVMVRRRYFQDYKHNQILFLSRLGCL